MHDSVVAAGRNFDALEVEGSVGEPGLRARLASLGAALELQVGDVDLDAQIIYSEVHAPQDVWDDVPAGVDAGIAQDGKAEHLSHAGRPLATCVLKFRDQPVDSD